jgi:hypothetical protein
MLKMVGLLCNFLLRRLLHRTMLPTTFQLPAIKLDSFINSRYENAAHSGSISLGTS